MNNESQIRLSINSGRLQARVEGRAEPLYVRIMYARPLSARTEVVLLDEDSQEVATLASLDVLDEPSQQAARAALIDRYQVPRITRILQAQFQHGSRYFDVETDRGRVTFVVREPGKNVSWLTDGQLIIRDTMGNPFEVPDVDALDKKSRRWIKLML